MAEPLRLSLGEHSSTLVTRITFVVLEWKLHFWNVCTLLVTLQPRLA